MGDGRLNQGWSRDAGASSVPQLRPADLPEARSLPAFGYGESAVSGKVLVPVSIFADVLADLSLGHATELDMHGAARAIRNLGLLPRDLGGPSGDDLMGLELTRYRLHADIVILRFERGKHDRFRVKGFDFEISSLQLAPDVMGVGRTSFPLTLARRLSAKLPDGVIPMQSLTNFDVPTFVAVYRTIDESDVAHLGLTAEGGDYAGIHLSPDQVIRSYQSETVWHELLCHAVPGATGSAFLHQDTARSAPRVPLPLKLSDTTERTIERIVRKAAISRLRGASAAPRRK